MQDEEKFENVNKSVGLIKWTISDFEANLPGVRMFSFARYALLLTWSVCLGGYKQLKINMIDLSSPGCHVGVLKEGVNENDIFLLKKKNTQSEGPRYFKRYYTSALKLCG